MSRFRSLAFLVCGVLSLATLGGCSSVDAAAPKARDPFTIDRNATPPILHLEPAAASRIGVQTSPTTGDVVLRQGFARGVAIPYGALLYKPDGTTLVYARIADGTFGSLLVTVDHIRDGVVALSAGPPAGTPVVTTGAAELMGIEYGVGK